jgi:hypothetical protein
MTIDSGQAGAMLADVEAIIARVKQSQIYRLAGISLIFWGAIIIAGNIVVAFAPHWATRAWVALDGLGAAATAVLLWRRLPASSRFPTRFVAAFALFVAFGLVWSTLLGRFGPRELDAFWPTLFLFGYALAGLWFGLAFSALGIGLVLLILAGYFWTGDWFNFYLALVNGGGLILCGALMRRA